MHKSRLRRVRDLVARLEPRSADTVARRETRLEALLQTDYHVEAITRFDMRTLHARSTEGTHGCIAGCAISAFPRLAKRVAARRPNAPATEIARTLLQLERHEARGLFQAAGYTGRRPADTATAAEAAAACDELLHGRDPDTVWYHALAPRR